MAWIESHTVLGRHRKLKELARDLRQRPVYTMGHLHALWHSALEQQEDGDLTSWTDELIAESAEYPGEAPQFVRLLQQHGWLDGRVIHDWLDYAGRYLTGKYRTSNPSRLKMIFKKHKTVLRLTKDGLKTDNLPNLTNHTKPTIEDIRAYFLEKKSNQTEADKFWNFYESNGWRVGKNLMKNWRAAAAGWLSRSAGFKTNGVSPAKGPETWKCFVCGVTVPEAKRREHMDAHKAEVAAR